MVTLAAWLLAIIVPLLRYALVALGFYLVTYAGMSYLHSQLTSLVQSTLSLISVDVYNIVALAGFVDVLGIWLGAISVAMVIMGVKKLKIL